MEQQTASDGAEAALAVLVIAHGSRRAEANEELFRVAEQLRQRGRFLHVQPAFLELASPDIDRGGELCVRQGARQVILLPYFLSAGRHVTDDLAAARDRLAARHPLVRFMLAPPLGVHPGLIDILLTHVQVAIAASGTGSTAAERGPVHQPHVSVRKMF